MKLVEKALLYKPRTTADTPWASYVTALALPAWWRMRDTSGSTATNSGAAGAALDGAIVAATLGQAGQLGTNEAFLYDGATTKITAPNVAAMAGLTSWEQFYLIFPTGAGESNNGILSAWNVGTGTDPQIWISGTLATLRVNIYNTLGTQFQTITSSGLTLNAWQLLFISYNDAGDRKVHLYKAIGGSVSELTYSAQPALTGTYKTPTSAFVIGNLASQALTFAGYFDEVAVGRVLLSTERTQLRILAGL